MHLKEECLFKKHVKWPINIIVPTTCMVLTNISVSHYVLVHFGPKGRHTECIAKLYNCLVFLQVLGNLPLRTSTSSKVLQ